MYRLNDMWSFTGKRLAWELEALLPMQPGDACDAMLLLARSYGAFARASGDEIARVNPDSEWMRRFNDVGQAVMFDLPRLLNANQFERFELLAPKSFMSGWQKQPYPSPLPRGA